MQRAVTPGRGLGQSGATGRGTREDGCEMSPEDPITGSCPVIVVDSSILERVQCNFLRGDWPALAAAARLGLLQLVLPDVVLSEVVAHHRRDLDKLCGDAKKLAEGVGQLQARPPALGLDRYLLDDSWMTLAVTSQVDGAVQSFRERIREFFLALLA